MLDIHTHILPHVDDGSKSVDQSIRMLRREVNQEVDKVALTPHFYAHKESLEDFLRRRNDSVVSLEKRLNNIEDVPQRYLGAEFAYFKGMSRVDDLDALCIGNSDAMLIEMPFCKWDRHVLDEIVTLWQDRGIRPIIAHVERYVRWQTPNVYGRLCDEGIWFQANTSFFLGRWSSLLAIHMLEKRMIHFIGSDCHDMGHRKPNMKLAMDRIGECCGKNVRNHLLYMERLLLEG